MSAVETVAINEGRHKRSMLFDSESKYSIINMINYANSSSEVSVVDGKLRAGPPF